MKHSFLEIRSISIYNVCTKTKWEIAVLVVMYNGAFCCFSSWRCNFAYVRSLIFPRQ